MSKRPINPIKKKTSDVVAPADGSTDPLFVIFEQHLLNFPESGLDRQTFIAAVVKDYIGTIRKMKIAVPTVYEQAIVQELGEQVNIMLLKKIYGFVSIEDYKEKADAENKRRVEGQYHKLKTRAG